MDTKLRKKVFSGADYIGLSDKERRVFKLVVEDMDERGLFHLSDCAVIAAYARNVLLARKASGDVEKYGTLITNEDKYHGTIVKENPAVGIMQRAQRAYEDSALKLGITPVGRKRTKGEEKQQKSAFEEFMDENQ